MTRRFLIAFPMLFIAGSLWAPINPSRLNIASEDGTVNTYPYKAKFSDGSVTDNNDGTVTISISAGVSVYPATGTAVFPYGITVSSQALSSSTIRVTDLSGSDKFLVSNSSTGISASDYHLQLVLPAGTTVFSVDSLGGVIISSLTVSSFTITNQLVLPTDAAWDIGYLTFGEQTAPDGAVGADVIWGDQNVHWLKFNPNNTTAYNVAGASTTVTVQKAACWLSATALGVCVSSVTDSGGCTCQ